MSYKTIGAISGHFPSAAERAATDARESERAAAIGADTDAEMIAGPAYLGQCVACGTPRYGADPAAPCGRCEMYRGLPDQWYLDGAGEWCAR